MPVSYLVDSGEVISERDRCPQCKGNKVSTEKKVLEVHVEKGMQHGERIVFQGEADQAVSDFKIFVLNASSWGSFVQPYPPGKTA